jgi:endoglucanase
VALNGGPVLSRGSVLNARVFELLQETAEREQIPYRVRAAPRDTGTDADNIFSVHRGVATGLVSVPLRYMHTPNELVALADLDLTTRLLAAFARRLTPDSDFITR